MNELASFAHDMDLYRLTDCAEFSGFSGFASYTGVLRLNEFRSARHWLDGEFGMTWIVCLCLTEPVIESADFPVAVQRAALAATIRVETREPDEQGSGVVVGHRDGSEYALTALHVVSKCKRVDIQTFTAKSYPKPSASYEKADIVWKAADCDLAMLRWRAERAGPALKLAALQKGMPMPFPVLSVGASLGAAPTPLADRVLSRKLVRGAAGQKTFFWQTAIAPEVGRSGGPLVDSAGRVIGICSASQDGKGYYVHIEEILAALKKHESSSILEERAEP